jgi:glutamine amidotransferase
MGRMLAATGDLDVRCLRKEFTRMAANDNPGYDHERRAFGANFQHEDGWGAAWVDGGRLRVRHSVHSCLEDPTLGELDRLQTDLLVLHARRSSAPGPPRLEDTHPYLLEYAGCSWAFCHNGSLYDLRSLQSLSGFFPEGSRDSERLFHHLLGSLECADAEEALLSGLESLEDYTALNCLLAAPGQVYAVAKRHPEKGSPKYHALWEGRGGNLHVVSSEPLDGIGCDSWERIPEPGVVTLKREIFTLRV